MNTIEISTSDAQRVLQLLRVTKTSLDEFRDAVPAETLQSMSEAFDVFTPSYAQELIEVIKMLEGTTKEGG
jgi:hypothetical protein